jgi:hypothetical protein
MAGSGEPGAEMPRATRHCKDGKRRGSYEHTSFTFLGYGFRVRKVRARHGEYFFGFNPAISDEAAKRIRAQIRSWRLHLRSGWSLKELAREVNMTVRGSPGVDQLLRAVPPVGVASQPQPHQRLPGAVGRAKVQAVPGQVEAGTGSAAEGRKALPAPVRPLDTRQTVTAERLDDGSRVNREVYARF